MAENTGDNHQPSNLGNGAQETQEQRNKTRLLMVEDAVDGILRHTRPFRRLDGGTTLSMSRIPLDGGGELVMSRIVPPSSNDAYVISAEIPQSDGTKNDVSFRWLSEGPARLQSVAHRPMEFGDGEWRRTASLTHTTFDSDDIQEMADLIYSARPPHEEFKGEGELPIGFDDESWQLNIDLAASDSELAENAKVLVSGSENPNLYGDMIDYVADKYGLSELEAVAAIVLCRERTLSTTSEDEEAANG